MMNENSKKLMKGYGVIKENIKDCVNDYVTNEVLVGEDTKNVKEEEVVDL